MKLRIAHIGDIQHQFCDECGEERDEVLVLADKRDEQFDQTEYPLNVCRLCVEAAVSSWETMRTEAQQEQRHQSDVVEHRQWELRRQLWLDAQPRLAVKDPEQ